MKKGNCASCKFWGKHGDSLWRQCNKSRMFADDMGAGYIPRVNEPRMYIKTDHKDIRNIGTVLVTFCNFGCHDFDEKEKQ